MFIDNTIKCLLKILIFIDNTIKSQRRNYQLFQSAEYKHIQEFSNVGPRIHILRYEDIVNHYFSYWSPSEILANDKIYIFHEYLLLQVNPINKIYLFNAENNPLICKINMESL